MTYDELSKNFIGIPSPGTKITGRFLPGVVGGISSPAQNPLAATASNELTRNDFRIMEEQRAADRQDDLRDMIQYWNELKKDEATSSTSDTQVKDPILIMEELREADRRDDERFMIQYWNELKEDEATNSTLNDVRQIK
jgi:hypothetical protein